jgi:hypothetical protein
VIAVLIGGMVFHNVLILNYFMIQRRNEEERRPVLRFDRSQVQHLLLTLAFVTLVVTGFALRFPNAWWVHVLQGVGMTEPVRLNLHRAAAVGMVIVALMHAWYVLVTRRWSSGRCG